MGKENLLVTESQEDRLDEVGGDVEGRYSSVILKRSRGAQRMQYVDIYRIKQPKRSFGNKAYYRTNGVGLIRSLQGCVDALLFTSKLSFVNRVDLVYWERKSCKYFRRKVAEYYYAHIWTEVV